MKKPIFDLEKDNCHVCQSQLKRNMTNHTESCVADFCPVKGVTFNIPYIVQKNKGSE